MIVANDSKIDRYQCLRILRLLYGSNEIYVIDKEKEINKRDSMCTKKE